MAISKNIELSSGLKIDDAYIRIDTVNGYKGGITISVNSYISQKAFKCGKNYLDQKFYSFVPNVDNNSENFIKQGYSYLKMLEEYKDATDVLEEGQII